MLNSDLPIKSSSEDVLNRNSFAENLAKVLLEYNVSEGFAIGIYGKWGSGKTSVINMILEHIEILSKDIDEIPVILRFNPWLCSDPKQLISQFFKQLSSVLKMKKLKLEGICDFLDNYADAFDFAGTIPIAGNILSIVGKMLGKKAKAYKDSINKDLQNIKDRIIDTLNNGKIKIIVTIDDVDRLSNEEIVSVFQLVKSLADFPYTIYLLAFDREIVIRALADVQKGDGAEYLEKVIQVPFELPTPNLNNIYQVFFEKLDSIISIQEDKWDKEYWSEIFHYGIKQYLNSIRDVVRFSNTFALKYALVKDDTYPIDLIGLICLQVFEPDVYSRLPSQKEQICGGTPGYHDTYQREKEKMQKAYNFLVEGIPKDRTEGTKNILIRLFPRLYGVVDNAFGYFKHYDHYKALNNGSISNPDCFGRYFALALESDAISQQEISYILFQASGDELIDAITKYNISMKATRFLDHIEAAFESTKMNNEHEERAKLVLKCLLWQWHKLDSNDDSDIFTMPFDWHLLRCSIKLLKTIGESCRYCVLNSMFHDVNVNISTVLSLLRYFESQHNRFTDNEAENQEKLFTLDEVLELEKAFIERVIDEMEKGVLLRNDSALYIIWFFEKLDETRAKEHTDKMIDSEIALANLVSAAVGHGKVASRTVYKTWKVKKEDISKYTDIEEVNKRINNFALTEEFDNLPDNKKENIAAFLISMEEKREQQNMRDDFDDYIVISDIENKLREIALQRL